jgi:hypothetical protein
MQKISALIKKYSTFLVLMILTVPTFWRMFPKGIYSMQDFHLFRLLQVEKCFNSLEIPCRWAVDAGLGYGEPVFNFYGQGVYWIGLIFRMSGVSLVDSTKILFALSLIGSALTMFWLSKVLWKNNFAALLSSLIYVYAPYRAVNVWVRGALPEAFGFVIFPIILYAIEKRRFVLLAVASSFLLISHNLSFIMFLPVIILWSFYRRYWKGFFGLVVAGLLSAFYILPVIFESQFVGLGSIVSGPYDFRAHFVTLRQIFLDRSWGYGGSTWGDGDGLNLSVGIVQWIGAIFTVGYLFLRKRWREFKSVLILTLSGLTFLFLTHNKSTFLWVNLPGIEFIQFPWRFLGVSVFSFSLAAGAVLHKASRKFSISVLVLVFVLLVSFNLKFFREDIWFTVDDRYFLTGAEWTRQRTASIGDFWPIYGPVPESPPEGFFGNWQPEVKKSNYQKFVIEHPRDSEISLPTAYFPGWSASIDGNSIPVTSSDTGMVNIEVPAGRRIAELKFGNTTPRIVGNTISLGTIMALLLLSKKTWTRKA